MLKKQKPRSFFANLKVRDTPYITELIRLNFFYVNIRHEEEEIFDI